MTDYYPGLGEEPHYPEVEYTKEDAIRDDLYRWWMDVAHVEAEACAEKAVEYGANSMTELGHEIAKLSGRTITDAEAIELACYFYIKGKLGRWSDAIMANKPVSQDTITDIGVYVRMVQRVRAVGDWPGWTEQPEPKRQPIGVAMTGYTAGGKLVTLDETTLKVEVLGGESFPNEQLWRERKARVGDHPPVGGDEVEAAHYSRSHPGQDMTMPDTWDGD